MITTFYANKTFPLIFCLLVSSCFSLDFYVDPNYVGNNDNNGSFSKPFANLTFLANFQMNNNIPVNVWLLNNITIISNVTLFQMNVSIMYNSINKE